MCPRLKPSSCGPNLNPFSLCWVFYNSSRSRSMGKHWLSVLPRLTQTLTHNSLRSTRTWGKVSYKHKHNIWPIWLTMPRHVSGCKFEARKPSNKVLKPLWLFDKDQRLEILLIWFEPHNRKTSQLLSWWHYNNLQRIVCCCVTMEVESVWFNTRMWFVRPAHDCENELDWSPAQVWKILISCLFSFPH